MENSTKMIFFLIAVIIALFVGLGVTTYDNSIIKYKVESEGEFLEKGLVPKTVIQITAYGTAYDNGFYMLCSNGEIWKYSRAYKAYVLIKEKDPVVINKE